VGALAAQVVLMAVLGVMLLLTPAVWVATAPLGWLAQGLMMALLAAVLYRYRFRWLTWAWAPPAPEPAAAPVPAVTGASRPAVARGAEAGPVVILPPPAPVPPALEPSFAVAEAAPEPGWAESRPGWERDLEEELRLLRYRLAQVATREAGRTLPAMPVGPREPLAPGWPGERVPPGSGEATDAVGPEPVLGEVAAGTPAGPAVGYRQRPPHRPEEGDLHLYRGRWR